MDRDVTRDSDATAAPPEPDAAFAAWFAAYPRQQGELPARRAWDAAAAAGVLPPLAEILARLELQKAGAQWQNPQFVPLPERYLREHRWRDQPTPPAKPPGRSPAAELRALGSDESRRQALLRISRAARFDPFDESNDGDPDA
ncbi:MAG TPA: hypothetical protein VHQ90_09415 [Thermoanaerobaculia bacterium]|nr:hypothetical protein [Thermoanaerobaculia bacterium]